MAALAVSLDLVVISHQQNAGYGANQKTRHIEALRDGADVIVMLHPDGQYDPAIPEDMVEVIRRGAPTPPSDHCFLNPGGARAAGIHGGSARPTGFSTAIENRVLGLGPSEYHTGHRAYSRMFPSTVPFLRNADDFVFHTQILTQAASFKFKVAEVPVTTRYFDDASSANFRVSLDLRAEDGVDRQPLRAPPPGAPLPPLLPLICAPRRVHNYRRAASCSRGDRRHDHGGEAHGTASPTATPARIGLLRWRFKRASGLRTTS